MNDLKRPLSELEQIYSDNNSGDIGPQDLRDGFKSSFGSYTVSSYNTNFLLSRDDIYANVDTTTGIKFAYLPSIISSDGSGDTFRNKFYYFNNIGGNELFLQTSGSDKFYNGSNTVTVSPKSTLGIVGVSGSTSVWEPISFFNTSAYSTIPSDLTLNEVSKNSKNQLDNTYTITSADSLYINDSDDNHIVEINNTGMVSANSFFGSYAIFDYALGIKHTTVSPPPFVSTGIIWVSADDQPYYTNTAGSTFSLILGNQDDWNSSVGSSMLQTTLLTTCDSSNVINNQPNFVLLSIGNSDVIVNAIEIFTDATNAVSKTFYVGLYHFNILSTATLITTASGTVTHSTGEYSKFTRIRIATTKLLANTNYYVGVNSYGAAEVKIRASSVLDSPPTVAFRLPTSVGLPYSIPPGSVPAGRQISTQAIWARLSKI